MYKTPQNIQWRDEHKLLYCLKREQDISIKPIFRGEDDLQVKTRLKTNFWGLHLKFKARKTGYCFFGFPL